ncbi:hypothetical protein N431DRAFT_84290 [Stipitochalara longipes BDJ]|nr:hypothetical protein N431DRAFT_84290 [Stipitochalara longipes BDJ]
MGWDLEEEAWRFSISPGIRETRGLPLVCWMLDLSFLFVWVLHYVTLQICSSAALSLLSCCSLAALLHWHGFLPSSSVCQQPVSSTNTSRAGSLISSFCGNSIFMQAFTSRCPGQRGHTVHGHGHQIGPNLVQLQRRCTAGSTSQVVYFRGCHNL